MILIVLEENLIMLKHDIMKKEKKMAKFEENLNYRWQRPQEKKPGLELRYAS